MSSNPDDMSFEEHAIAWCIEEGRDIPPPKSPEWDKMYAKWVDFAFGDI